MFSKFLPLLNLLLGLKIVSRLNEKGVAAVAASNGGAGSAEQATKIEQQAERIAKLEEEVTKYSVSFWFSSLLLINVID